MSGKNRARRDEGKETSDPEILEASTEKKADSAAAVSGSVEDLKERLAEAENRATASYDQFLRASAELENYKKRKQKEMEDFRKFANESILRDLLTVVDNLERAVEIPKNEGGETQLSEGLDLTLRELLKIFQKFGVQPIACLGASFDPAFHQAMMQQEVSGQPDNIVIQELQKGYVIHERLLRPSMVVVSKAKANNKSADKGVEETQ
jgi:molecular chaperone GrpE